MKPIRDKLGDPETALRGRRYGRMDGEAYLDLLAAKLHEEADEVQSALGIGGEVLLEELADIIEVALAIAIRRGSGFAELVRLMEDKRDSRGAFAEGYVIA